MTEIVEYTLAFLASTLVVGASVFAYSNFESGAASTRNSVALSALTSAAVKSTVEGSAKVTIALSASTLSCTGSTLELRTGNSVKTSQLPISCDFPPIFLNGTMTIQFVTSGGEIYATVG